MKRRRRHILFFDGTRNTAKTDTNIYRLYKLTLDKPYKGVQQIPKYWEGLGVQRAEKIRGGAFGRYLWASIMAGYRWLALNHRDGDEIYLFGFSRGAFTAMGLAGLLAWRGLPKTNVPNDTLDRHLEIYRNATQHSREKGKPGSRPLGQLQTLSDDEKSSLPDFDKEALKRFRWVPIQFVGVFDTVRAAGLEVTRWVGTRLPVEVPPDEHPDSRGTLALRYTRHLPPNVVKGFHALAVDEKRAVFHPRVWIIPIPSMTEEMPEGRYAGQYAEQRWFLGAHANVGGGYPGNPLDLIPLRWMQAKAEAAGIGFKEQVFVPQEAYLGDIEKSYDRFLGRAVSWKRFLRPVYLGQEAAKHRVENSTIDETVLRRIVDDKDYYPQNLKDSLAQLATEKHLPDSIDMSLLQQCLVKFARCTK
jgi:hypothetical protein